jgi:hypothetical protein
MIEEKDKYNLTLCNWYEDELDQPCYGEIDTCYVEMGDDCYMGYYCEGHANYGNEDYAAGYIPKKEKQNNDDNKEI